MVFFHLPNSWAGRFLWGCKSEPPGEWVGWWSNFEESSRWELSCQLTFAVFLPIHWGWTRKKKKCIISPNISPDYFYVIAVFSSWAESLNPKNRLHFGAVDRKRKGMMRALGISIQDSSYPLFLLKKKVKSKRDGKMVFFSKPISWACVCFHVHACISVNTNQAEVSTSRLQWEAWSIPYGLWWVSVSGCRAMAGRLLSVLSSDISPAAVPRLWESAATSTEV